MNIYIIIVILILISCIYLKYNSVNLLGGQKSNIPFNVLCYKYRYMDLKNMTDAQATAHWNNHGKNEFRNGSCNDAYVNPKGIDKAINIIFNAKCYKYRYTQLKDGTDKSVTTHWNKYGRGENRNGSCDDTVNNKFGKDIYFTSIIPIEQRNPITLPLLIQKSSNSPFNVLCYKHRYMDLKNMTDNEARHHWTNYGINEFRNGSCNNDYINPMGTDKAINSIFNVKCYKYRYTQLKDVTDEIATSHWNKHGRGENRNGSCDDKLNNVYGRDKYIRSIIPIEQRNPITLPLLIQKSSNSTFNVLCYKHRYMDLKNMTNDQATAHWNNHGKNEFRNGSCNDAYVNPNGIDKAINIIFNAKCYKYRYPLLTNGSDESVTNHWIMYGRGENRNGSCDDSVNNKFGKDLYFTSIIPIEQRNPITLPLLIQKSPKLTPSTQAPITQAPITQAPITQAPITQAPITQAPITQKSSTLAPSTFIPLTQSPITQAPITQKSSTLAPSTFIPLTQAPITPSPLTQEPLALLLQEPLIQEPLPQTHKPLLQTQHPLSLQSSNTKSPNMKKLQINNIPQSGDLEPIADTDELSGYVLMTGWDIPVKRNPICIKNPDKECPPCDLKNQQSSNYLNINKYKTQTTSKPILKNKLNKIWSEGNLDDIPDCLECPPCNDTYNINASLWIK